MTNLLDYILQPSTLVSLVTSLIAFISAYKGLEYRVKTIEEKQRELDPIDIKVKIAEIQKDLQYLRESFDKVTKKS